MLEGELFPSTARSHGLPRFAPPAFGAILALLLLLALALGDRSIYMLAPFAAVAALAVVYYGVRYTVTHVDWLPFSLALVALLVEISFLDENTRAPLHYGLVALLCLPVAPRVWRSGILGVGGFRLYCIYFAWGAVTVAYSLSPLYSAARLGESVLVMIALAACVLEIREPADVSRLLAHFLLACGVMLLALGAAWFVLPHSLGWVAPQESYTRQELANFAKAGISVFGIDRFRGLFNGPNDVGGLMLVVIGAAMIRWRAAERRERMMLMAMAAAALAFDILADSRSPFVAIGIGCAAYAMWRWGIRGVLLTGAAVALTVAVMLHMGMASYIGRGDVATLTGRTDIWEFVVRRIRERPILGYGYETSGALFQSKYFPLWWGPWDLGPHSSLHDGYLGHAVGVGIPATLMWLYIALRPWVFALRQRKDPWNLKPTLFLLVVPILIDNCSEQVLGDFGGGIAALLFGLAWAIAERHRLLALERVSRESRAARAALPGAVRALASAASHQAAD